MQKVHEQAYEDYKNGMNYKELAEKYSVTINTVKSWKTRYKWPSITHTQSEKCAKSVQSKKELLWLEMEIDYIMDISGNPCKLGDLAKKYGVSERSVKALSSKNNWKLRRKKYIESAKQKVAEKTSDIVSDRMAEVNSRYYHLSNKILKAIDKALEDEQELFKYVEVLKQGYGAGEFEEQISMTKLTAINHKKAVDLTKAIKDNQDIQRKALDILSLLDKHRIDCDNKKLELEERKITKEANGAEELEAWANIVTELDGNGE